MSDLNLSQSPIETLRSQHFCTLDFPVAPEKIQGAVDAFFRFLEESEEVKSRISFSVNPAHRRGDIGYCHRNSSDDIYYDDKEYFHYHPGIFSRYPELLATNEAVRDFCEKALPIWEAARDRVRTFLSEHAELFGEVHKGIFDCDEPHIQLRFLKYFYQNPGRHLAKGHFDAGTCTLAIAESDPGLRIGANEETLQAIEHKEGEAIFMLGRNFPEVANKEFRPSWHDVIQLGEEIDRQAFSRWALVSFFSVHGVNTVSRDETHQSHIDGM